MPQSGKFSGEKSRDVGLHPHPLPRLMRQGCAPEHKTCPAEEAMIVRGEAMKLDADASSRYRKE